MTRPAWAPPADAERVELVQAGPFVVREVVRRPDGSLLVYTGRRARKGLGPLTADPAGPAHRRVLWAPHRLAWWIAVLFMIGSACFAIGSAPGVSSALDPGVVGAIFFVGSLFFTAAGYSQYHESINAGPASGVAARRRWLAWQPTRIDWWASAVQLVGTLWFNVNTFDALRTGLDTHQQNLRIWTPDVLGSVCFLVASAFAVEEVCHGGSYWRPDDVSWRIVALNLVGSVAFMASALAAFALPSTGELLDATLANSGTFVGAVCFFWAAKLLLDEMASAPRPVGEASPGVEKH